MVPASIFGWVVWHDVVSAVLMAVTLPLVPIFGVLIGKVTEARTLKRFATLSHLSAHFLDVVRGLPTLRAFGRGKSQSVTIAAVSDAYRIETMGTLRIAFLSALVLELAATMSTAVIAAEIGIRLVDGGIALAPALAILVLAPELLQPAAERGRAVPRERGRPRGGDTRLLAARPAAGGAHAGRTRSRRPTCARLPSGSSA